MAVCFSACRLALLAPTLVFTCRDTPLAWREPFRVAALPTAAALAAALLLRAAAGTLLREASWPGLIGSAVLYGVLYLVLIGRWLARIAASRPRG
jgi:hypothetical protein